MRAKNSPPPLPPGLQRIGEGASLVLETEELMGIENWSRDTPTHFDSTGRGPGEYILRSRLFLSPSHFLLVYPTGQALSEARGPESLKTTQRSVSRSMEHVDRRRERIWSVKWETSGTIFKV